MHLPWLLNYLYFQMLTQQSNKQHKIGSNVFMKVTPALKVDHSNQWWMMSLCSGLLKVIYIKFYKSLQQTWRYPTSLLLSTCKSLTKSASWNNRYPPNDFSCHQLALQPLHLTLLWLKMRSAACISTMSAEDHGSM